MLLIVASGTGLAYAFLSKDPNGSGAASTGGGRGPGTIAGGGGEDGVKDGDPVMFEVSFDSMGGTDVGTLKVASGAKMHTPEPPAKAGYVFDGWFRETDLANRWNFAIDCVEG
ncbi:MAG: InlB B-repeat-containing protein, partial [Candidatus Methanoplasma sp.]|nr:InlB B-repeat-containing protein [Candidatus Methanoplasma sp.]